MNTAARRPRILVVLHELSRSGAPKLVLDLFEGLAADVDVRFLAIRGGPLADRCRTLGKLDILPRMPLGGPMAQKLGARFERAYTKGLRLLLSSLSTELTKWNPDLIYLNSVWSAPVSKNIDLPSAPILLHVHELQIGISMAVRLYRKQLLERPSYYIAVSDSVRNALIGDHGVSETIVETIHGAVPDQYVADNGNIQPRIFPTGKPLTVGGCGTPYWRKGIFLWLQTARAVIDHLGPDAVQFQWIGVSDPDEMLMCVESARKLGVENSVEFIASTPEPLTWFRNFDIFAMTSIEDPCPIVVLENMMLGTPVICFADGGGTVEEIGDTGISIPNFSVAQMAEEIIALSADRDRLQAIGQGAYERIRSHFLVSTQAPKILSAINRAVKMSEAVSQSQG